MVNIDPKYDLYRRKFHELSLPHLSTQDLWTPSLNLVVSTTPTKVKQIEQEAYENAENVPEAQRAAYKTMALSLLA